MNLNDFRKLMKKCGEMVFEPLTKEHLKMVFKHQGRWSGVDYYIYYNENNKEFYAERKY